MSITPERIQQLDLFATIQVLAKPKCDGHIGFMSTAHVPNGLFCSNCNMIVSRLIPPPKNEPEILGYTTATWAWKYKHGNEWSNDLEVRDESIETLTKFGDNFYCH